LIFFWHSAKTSLKATKGREDHLMNWILSIFLSLSGGLSESDWQDLIKVFQNVKTLYSELPMELIVEKNYFIHFEHEAKALEENLLDSRCHDTLDFKETSAQEVTQIWYPQIQKAATIGLKGRARQLFSIKADRNLAKIQSLLEKTSIELCEDEETPAYSDKHTRFFVRLKDGSVLLMFEEGYHD
jgi:hypothetical protein